MVQDAHTSTNALDHCFLFFALPHSVPLPLFFAMKLGDSVVQFFTKTKAEMTGDADTVGAGAKVLVKGLVGGTFGSAAKMTGVSRRLSHRTVFSFVGVVGSPTPSSDPCEYHVLSPATRSVEN